MRPSFSPSARQAGIGFPAPHSTLAKKIMARVRAQAPPRFRLRGFDYALSAHGASVAGVLLLILQTVPPQAIERTGLRSTILVDRLLTDFWNLAATGCWYCTR